MELEPEIKDKKRKQVGILGGNFNPVHNAHLVVADQVRQQLGLDKVLLMPEYEPPHVDKKEPSHYIEEQELVTCINHFLKMLPKEQRVMFVRRYWYCDNITAIAERCMCSESRVKTTLFRIRGKMVDFLKKEGYAP